MSVSSYVYCVWHPDIHMIHVHNSILTKWKAIVKTKCCNSISTNKICSTLTYFTQNFKLWKFGTLLLGLFQFRSKVNVCFSKKVRVLLNGTKIRHKDHRFKSMAANTGTYSVQQLRQKFNSNTYSLSYKIELQIKKGN